MNADHRLIAAQLRPDTDPKGYALQMLRCSCGDSRDVKVKYNEIADHVARREHAIHVAEVSDE